MYGIYHMYDVDGGFGDAVPKQELVATCESEEIAKKYCEKHDKNHIYDRPYADLYCGKLVYGKINVPVITEENIELSPWTDNVFYEAREVTEDEYDEEEEECE